MASAGWYPDPDGTPNRLRFWDGQSWTQQTQSAPQGGAPQSGPQAGGPQSGPQGGGPQFTGGQPQYGGQGGQSQYGPAGGRPEFAPSGPTQFGPQPGQPQYGPGGGNKSSRTPLLIIIGVVGALVIALVAWLVFFNKPDRPGGVQTPSGAQTQPGPAGPSTADGGIPLGNCPFATGQAYSYNPSDPGRIYGGHLSMPLIANWVDDGFQMPAKYIALGQMQYSTVIADAWIAPAQLGQVFAADGHTDLKTSAEQITGCVMGDPGMYAMTDSKFAFSQSTTVSGQPAWHVRTDVMVDPAKHGGATGDRLDVIMVNTGDPDSFSLLIIAVPVDSPDLQSVADQAIADLRIES